MCVCVVALTGKSAQCGLVGRECFTCVCVCVCVVALTGDLPSAVL